MKTSMKLFALGMILLGFAANVNAQVSATATSTATIVTPIAINKTVDMNFGNVAINNQVGTVILAPESTRTFTGGITLPVVTGTVTAASFNVTGQADYTYSITLPSSVLLTRQNGSETMTVDEFTSTPTPTGKLNGSGSQVLNVGATLNVGASQVAGTYVSGTPFTVTVNYN